MGSCSFSIRALGFRATGTCSVLSAYRWCAERSICCSIANRFNLGKQAAVLAVGISLLLLAPRVATQAIPDKAVAVFNNYAALDVIRTKRVDSFC